MHARAVPFVLVASLIAVPAGAASLADVFEQVNPSVVVVETTVRSLATTPGGTSVYATELGSGVLVTADGKILTAAHVVQTAESVRVKFLDGTWVPARVAASEPWADIAVVQARRVPESARVAELADSDDVAPGDDVFVIGAPLGVEHSLSAGVLSARRMPDVRIGGLVPVELLQTDAAIHQGNSGGPLFDRDGRVIGIVSHLLTRSGGSQGIGFAVSANTARAVVLERRSLWSGVAATVLDESLAKLLNVPPPYLGMLIQQVAAGSPGEHMQLRGGEHVLRVGEDELIVGGDVLLEIQGVPLDGIDNFVRARDVFDALGDRDLIRLKVLRAGEIVELTSTFVEGLLVPPPAEPAS